MITLTEAAADKIKILLEKKEETGIRAAVRGGGCSGFTYHLKFDNQNEKDPAYVRNGRSNYIKMSDNFENSIAFSAACDLVFKGRTQPSGYTEPLLHQKRLEKKKS